jgi:hypothetical protein
MSNNLLLFCEALPIAVFLYLVGNLLRLLDIRNERRANRK